MIVVYAPDLMDRSKIQVAGGDRVRFVPTVAALTEAMLGEGIDRCLVDLSRAGVLEAVTGASAAVTGFVSHVDDETRRAAEAGGVAVLARSVFFRRLAELVGPGPGPSPDPSPDPGAPSG